MKGQAKEDFEKWLSENYLNNCINLYSELIESPVGITSINITHIPYFANCPESMKWGIIQDWFDSVEIELNTSRSAYLSGKVEYDWNVYYDQDTEMIEGESKSRQEARNAAIEKAVEIYNSRK